MLFAQLPSATDSVAIAGWIGVLFFLLAGTNSLLKLVDRLKEKPVPADTYATKAEMEHVRQDVNALRMEAKQTRETILQEGRTRAAGIYHKMDDFRRENKEDNTSIHKRVDQVLEAVSELRGRLIGKHH